MVYFKLGDLATVFSDPFSGVSIVLDEIVALEHAPKNTKFKKALSGGHLQKASASEYDDYMKLQKSLMESTVAAGDSPEVKTKLVELQKRENRLAEFEKNLAIKAEALEEKEKAIEEKIMVPKDFPEKGSTKDLLMEWAATNFEEPDVKLANKYKSIEKLRAFLLTTSQGYTFE